MQDANIHDKYERRVTRFGKKLSKQKKIATRLSNLRLVTFILGAISTFVLYRANYDFFSGLSFLVTLIIFSALVIWHRKILIKANHLSFLHQINNDSLKRIKGEWKAFEDSGQDFRDENHSYANDLDIFGQGSLFQWISTAKTFIGRLKLRGLLADEPKGQEEIQKRQEAIKELATNLSWRQRYLAEGMLSSQKAQDPASLFKWAKQSYGFYQTTLAKVVFRIIPLITIGLIISFFTLNVVPFYWPVLAIIAQALILFLVGKNRSLALRTVSIYAANINAYKNMLKHFESKKFKSKYLKRLQKELTGNERVSAFKQIEKLEKIVDAISDRNNAMFLMINIILLWDYQCMMALEQWKQNSGRNLEKWLNIVGEVEALASLAIINHDYPDWAMPLFREGEPALIGKDMGHPLLADGRIYNDIKLDEEASVLLITGSNMSGKSTYLRTAGINLVLAYAGAPVCASYFHCSPMTIYTCMRVSDNLEKNISSFYAELLRVKLVVAATKKDEQIFFLLDEIFKGTNSQDRHLGAKILIKELTDEGAIGMVSTHDLELGELEKESNRRIKNYHFKEYYVNGKISFDYKLRSGISTTRNALYLMRMVGIDTENNDSK